MPLDSPGDTGGFHHFRGNNSLKRPRVAKLRCNWAMLGALVRRNQLNRVSTPRCIGNVFMPQQDWFGHKVRGRISPTIDYSADGEA
jgi:hypothetical protein